jgi:hypothetical protein
MRKNEGFLGISGVFCWKVLGFELMYRRGFYGNAERERESNGGELREESCAAK